MYARTNTGSTHGDFQDRNGVNYVTSTESFGHCSQLFWKKDPNDSGPSSTISWCDQLPSSSAALSSSSLSSTSLSSSSLSMESRPPAPATTASDDMESDERPYVCDLCSCAYKHASSLLNHKLTHKTGDFRCDFCSKPYTNYMSLRNHMRIHGQKRYMCDLCGKAFRLARYLRNHQRIHDDGPNRFDCPSCCKSYRTMLELAQHRCSAAASNQPGSSPAHLRHTTASSSSSTTAQQQQKHHDEPQHGRTRGHSSSVSPEYMDISSHKHASSSIPHLLLLPQFLVPEPKHQDTFSLAPQRPLTTINPIGHSLHPNGAPTLKPSPVPRTIQAMPWEQRSLYNQ
ncbi:zinc finger protein 646-like isoform X6 [Lates japonicus]|uniref:Zinc finger protein 646-like isoform X6 n=1 Tax=Lates japonicus TaxID=270547 RepID=A0AAD3RA25_LATJO|nr:zinc finger protein 646-like isoform X6 [Lates japonicus]